MFSFHYFKRKGHGKNGNFRYYRQTIIENHAPYLVIIVTHIINYVEQCCVIKYAFAH